MEEWYCFYHGEWHLKGRTCLLNKKYYNILDHDEFYEFISKHHGNLEKALKTRSEGVGPLKTHITPVDVSAIL